jgi:hypothetical protein
MPAIEVSAPRISNIVSVGSSLAPFQATIASRITLTVEIT